MLYSLGLTTGTVIDIGESHTTATPIFEGIRIAHAEQRSPIGCLQLSDFIIDMLKPRVSLTTSFDRLITAKQILEFGHKGTGEYCLPDGRVLGSVAEEQGACVEALFDNQLFLTASNTHDFRRLRSDDPKGIQTLFHESI